MRALPLKVLTGIIFLISVNPLMAFAQEPTSDQDHEVAGVAYAFLAALSATDAATLSGLLAPQAMIYSVREGPEGPSLRAVTREAFLESLAGEDQEFLERMWNPEVSVQGRVAMVWAPYDFHLNGQFSHCGIDVFTMLMGEEGWQVASITYNVVRDGCSPSPLGPPGRGGT
jgi:hypothetical protein